MLFNALSGLSNPPAAVESIVREVLMACGSCYKVDFSHIKRQGNSQAHLLGKHALGIVDYETWMEASPCFLEQALIHDVSFLV